MTKMMWDCAQVVEVGDFDAPRYVMATYDGSCCTGMGHATIEEAAAHGAELLVAKVTAEWTVMS